MTTTQYPSYRRAPSPDLKRCLQPGGFLAPLLDLTGVAYDTDNSPNTKWRAFRSSRPFASHDIHFRLRTDYFLDLHFRLDDSVQLYRGLTSILKSTLLQDGRLKIEANQRYTEHSFSVGLFRTWSPNESGFAERLTEYLLGMKNWERQKDNTDVQKWKNRWVDGEGNVQANWAQIGVYPWTPFDREAVVKYGEKKENSFPEVEDARKKIDTLVSINSWAQPPWKQSKSEREVDQLAIDLNGNLTLIEIKDAKPDQHSSIYYAPIQLLQYLHEWNSVLIDRPQIQHELQELIDARKALFSTSERKLGMIPIPVSDCVPQLSGRLRAVICFGRDDRSDEVKDRFSQVLRIANEHLPSGLPPIETWRLQDNEFPEKLSL